MNVLKTWLLMGTMSVLLVIIGNAFGGASGATGALVLALGLNFFGYWYSDRLVLSMSHAEPLNDSEYPEVRAMAARLAVRAGIPEPKLYTTPQDQPNAFATGRTPANAAVAFTRGMLRSMAPDEIEGVLAHEMSHIAHYDTLVGTLAATLAGAITWVAYAARWAAMFGGGGRRGRNGENAVSGIASLLTLVLAPIAATLIQLAISRSREFHADASAAALAGSPTGLAKALEHLGAYTRQIPLDTSPSSAHLYIVSPFAGARGMSALFSTHPPLEERIRRLRHLQ